MGKNAPHNWRSVLRQQDAVRWELPVSYMPGMRVPGLIFADEAMIDSMAGDMAIQQVAPYGRVARYRRECACHA